LHFTKDVLERLKEKGVNIAYITLHVSAGTFLPIKSEHIENHNMHYEEYFIEKEIAGLINSYLENENKKITCVGTTSLRTLENELICNNVVKEAINQQIFLFIRV
jgi:S-adenosylmethionine:tRNA ribosyltransferase-isomerase